MVDIYNFIDSKSIREYNRLIETKFTPIEQAVIIQHSKNTTAEEKLSAWREVLGTYSEADFQTAKILFVSREGYSNKQLIENTVRIYELGFALADNSENYVFKTYIEDVNHQYNDENPCMNMRYFSSYKKAYDYLCRSRAKCYECDDTRPLTYDGRIFAVQLDNPNGVKAAYFFDNAMRLIDIDCFGEEIEDGMLFHINVPMPFRKGDIVRTLDVNYYESYGVISQDIDEKYYADTESIDKYFGWKINCQCIEEYEGKEIVSEFGWGMFPLMIEFCTDDELPERERRLMRLRKELRHD